MISQLRASLLQLRTYLLCVDEVLLNRQQLKHSPEEGRADLSSSVSAGVSSAGALPGAGRDPGWLSSLGK